MESATDKKFSISTGRVHVFRVLEPIMTISFELSSPSQVLDDYPKYTLKSEDGSYDEKLSPKNDLVPGDRWLQLRFENLIPGLRYRLTRELRPRHEEVLFNSLHFNVIVDQERSVSRIFRKQLFSRLKDVEEVTFDDVLAIFDTQVTDG